MSKKQLSTGRSRQPRGLKIIYEDRDIIVVDKMNGLLTIGTDRDKQHTVHFALNEYVKKGNPKSRERVYVVHRLDRDTSGILVFARTEKAKRFLQDNWKEFRKKYIAVVQGQMEDNEGIIESYLAENKMFRVYSTKDTSQGKFAKTGYKVVKKTDRCSFLEIDLYTGRKNQIRVHLSDKGCPIIGDKVYGKTDKAFKRMALHSYSLAIIHPFTKKEMCFTTEIPVYFDQLVNVK